jgi:hypothetical protein
MMMMKEKADI